jgi:hypothetical protein
VDENIVKIHKAVTNKNYNEENIDADLSLTGGQGVKKCNCRTSDCNSGSCSCKVANRQCNSKCHGGNANNNCCRPGTGTTGLEADEEQTPSSSQATQPLIKIGVSTRGRGSGRVRGSRGFGSRK